MDEAVRNLEEITRVAKRLKAVFVSAGKVKQGDNGRQALQSAGERIETGLQALQHIETWLPGFVRTEVNGTGRGKPVGPKEGRRTVAPQEVKRG
jgi:hypothetical protein